MKNYIKIVLLSVLHMAANSALGVEEPYPLGSGVIDNAKGAAFVVKIGGPISCGAHQLLIHEFDAEKKLSCMNDSINEKLEQFNADNKQEVFLVLWGGGGDFSEGDIVKANNEAGLGLVYGDKYLIFINGSADDLSFERCMIFEASAYRKMLASLGENLTMEALKKYITHNNTSCINNVK